MEVVVIGRHTEISDRFRTHVEEKVSKVQQFSPYAQRVDVEITREHNPRQADQAERVELTVRAKGPVVRAEASSSERHAALDIALDKLFERLRRDRDRRKRSYQGRTRPDATPLPSREELLQDPAPVVQEEVAAPPKQPVAGEVVETQLGDSPVIIRQKVHESVPMSVDQALSEMELVGHPFFLFVEEETKQPCVVYHRHGWTYGVIRLDVKEAAEPAQE